MTKEQAGPVAVVTGASGAIGRAIAEALAASSAWEVVLVGRNEAKLRDLTREICRKTENDKVRFELADLSRLSSIQDLAKRWKGPLHVLVNNAAIAPRRRAQTPEGIELQLATNVLGYLWMMEELFPALVEGAPSRVVNVASYWAGGLDLQDLEFVSRRYDNDAAYRQSKQANRMSSRALGLRWVEHGVRVNACHPGDVPSALSHSLGFGGHETPEEGARTPVWLARSPAGSSTAGGYFERCTQTPCRFSQDSAQVEALLAALRAYRPEPSPCP